MALGCCNDFKKCSDAGTCLFEIGHENIAGIEFKECLYKENLDEGLNFYTEYNENNRLRKDEYEEKIQEEKSNKILDLPIKTKKKCTKTYIEIPNRLFLVTKRGYGWWSRDLDNEERSEFVETLKSKGLICHMEHIENLFKDEELAENDRCNSKVRLKIDDKNYVIHNYNCRGLKQVTAEKVANYLVKKGLDADVEVVQGFGGSKIIKSSSTKKIIEQRAKEKTKIQQINMFGEQVNGMFYVN